MQGADTLRWMNAPWPEGAPLLSSIEEESMDTNRDDKTIKYGSPD